MGEGRAGIGLSSPPAYAEGNLRGGVPHPFGEMHVGIGSINLPRSHFFDDFTRWSGPTTTGTEAGWTVIATGTTIQQDLTDQLEGNGKLLLVGSTGASDTAQIGTALPITAMGAGRRQVVGCRFNVDDVDESAGNFALVTAGADLFALTGDDDKIQFFWQGLNAGNAAGVVIDKDAGGPTSLPFTTAVRDEILAAMASVVQLAMVVNADNSVDALYSTDDGMSWKLALNISETEANLPDEATDTMTLAFQVAATLTNTVNCSLDWMTHSKEIQ